MSVRAARSACMSVTFRCRWDSDHEGEPLRATPCRCGPRQALDEDGLCWCGHFPAETVNHTWAQQAWVNAKAQRPVSASPVVFREDRVLEVQKAHRLQRRYGRAA